MIGVGATVAAARSKRCWSSTPSSMNFREMWKERVRRGASAAESDLADFPARIFFSLSTRLGVTAAFGRPPLSLAAATVARTSQRIILSRRALTRRGNFFQAVASKCSFSSLRRVRTRIFDGIRVERSR